jgi:Ran GTPase-activating protein (RanGAP) involved in mRNA processing and transport
MNKINCDERIYKSLCQLGLLQSLKKNYPEPPTQEEMATIGLETIFKYHFINDCMPRLKAMKNIDFTIDEDMDIKKLMDIVSAVEKKLLEQKDIELRKEWEDEHGKDDFEPGYK